MGFCRERAKARFFLLSLFCAGTQTPPQRGASRHPRAEPKGGVVPRREPRGSGSDEGKDPPSLRLPPSDPPAVFSLSRR
ncbi:MAG: hypothetical protein D6679_10995 [Candidatus Hydrogenedentota bacterium]|nr:MAG: hypothetical protein D6679_10995 [Candidatus Hydrogenedentota bacterium]